MITLECKLLTSIEQKRLIEEYFRVVQFVRNRCVRLWMDTGAKGYDLIRYTTILSKKFDFVKTINAECYQNAAERAISAIGRYTTKSKTGNYSNKPKYQKDNRSIEYKTNGWKLSSDKKYITFKKGIGRCKILGSQQICAYDLSLIKRVRIVRKANMYFCQFLIDIDKKEEIELSGKSIGLDLGLSSFYTDSNGVKIDCSKFFRKSEKSLARQQRKLSRKQKGSNNRNKQRIKVARIHLKIQRQRKDFVTKLARCVVKSNDLIVLEDLKVSNLVKNHKLSKSISDASWSIFVNWLEYYGKVFNRTVIKVNPAYTSQDCSNCGNRVKKSLSIRTHICSCGLVIDRDENAALNILQKGLDSLLV